MMDFFQILDTAQGAIGPHMFEVYLCLLIAPFIQEDAAIVAAASLSLAGVGDGPLIFALATLGLAASDLWKYWIGRAARTQKWAARLAEKPAVAKAGDLVRGDLGKALMSARFIPGTRIPLYIASGYFGARWPRFAFWILVSATSYVAAMFAIFHTVGLVAGDAAKIWLPVIAVAALIIALGANALRRKGKTEQG